MKKLVLILAMMLLSNLEAEMNLDYFSECSKLESFERLKTTSDSDLWGVFLKAQTSLFFDTEFSWIRKGSWWKQAEHILELGSGDGSYLNELSKQFEGKKFTGVELLPEAVEKANLNYAKQGLSYQEGDAEIFDPRLENLADLVLFRLTLQHLKDPRSALLNAAEYLSEGGHIVIIDSYDAIRESSHPIPTIDKAWNLVAETQKNNSCGNRKISFEILEEVENKLSPLSELFEVAYSNLDLQGQVIGDTIRFEGEQKTTLYAKLVPLLAELIDRKFNIGVDFHILYEEVEDYLNDSEAWTSPGAHFLVLKKKSN